jgi:putative phosphoesterase
MGQMTPDNAADHTYRVGLISDTHGLLRDEALNALAGCGLIVHAGDVGRPEILERLRAIAPVVAVRGNVDTADWARALPETAVAEAGGVRLFVLHDVKTLADDPAALGYGVVVSGHSHKPSETWRGGVLYVNPGSCGPRRFRLPVTVARLEMSARPYRVEFVTVG